MVLQPFSSHLFTTEFTDRGRWLTLLVSRYGNQNIALQCIDGLTQTMTECTIDIPGLEVFENECLIPEKSQDYIEILVENRLIQSTDLTVIYTRCGHRAIVYRVCLNAAKIDSVERTEASQRLRSPH